MPDFEFDVGISVEEIRGDFEFVDESIRQLGSSTALLANTFLDMEKSAIQAGISVRELGGITRRTEDAYKDFIRTFTSHDLRSSVLTIFTPTIEFFQDVGNQISNIRSGTAEFALAGKRVRRLSTEEAQRKDDVRLAREAKLRREIEEEFQEDRQELRETAFERVEERRVDFVRDRARRRRRAALDEQLDAIDERAFGESQAERRSEFLARQDIALLDPSNVGVAARIRRRIQLEQFELGQESQQRQRAIREEASGEKREIRKANQADEAMIRLSQDIRDINKPIVEALERIAERRATALSLVEDIVP